MMRIAQKFAGYSLAEADNLRKACGKKNKELIAKERVKFTEGCERTGYGADLGTQWFDIIEPFADYAFNKSPRLRLRVRRLPDRVPQGELPRRSTSPRLLTSVKQSLEKAAIYLAECRDHGHRGAWCPTSTARRRTSRRSRPPSDGHRGAAILFGLSAVRNVGEGLVELIVAERDANGPFADFYDFCERVNTGVLNKRTIESLIKAGGFDSHGPPPPGPAHGVRADRRRHRGPPQGARHGRHVAVRRARRTAPPSTSGSASPTSSSTRSSGSTFEKEMLGLYVSDHPLLGAEQAAASARSTAPLAELAEVDDGAQRTVGGVITGLQRKWTKKGDLMAVFTLEDLQGRSRSWCSPRPWPQSATCWPTTPWCIVSGTGRQAGRHAQAHRAGRSSCSSRWPTGRRRCGCTCPRPASTTPWWTGSRSCSPTSPASPRCTSCWASARCCGCPTSSW